MPCLQQAGREQAAEEGRWRNVERTPALPDSPRYNNALSCHARLLAAEHLTKI